MLAYSERGPDDPDDQPSSGCFRTDCEVDSGFEFGLCYSVRC